MRPRSDQIKIPGTYVASHWCCVKMVLGRPDITTMEISPTSPLWPKVCPRKKQLHTKVVRPPWPL